MTLPSQAHPSISSKSSKKLELLDIDPMKLARQLTLLEFDLYKRIRPMECIQRSRESKPGKLQDNITSIIQLSNRVSSQTLLFTLFARIQLIWGCRLPIGWRILFLREKIHGNELSS